MGTWRWSRHLLIYRHEEDRLVLISSSSVHSFFACCCSIDVVFVVFSVDFTECHKCDSRTDPACVDYQSSAAEVCADYLDACVAYIGELVLFWMILLLYGRDQGLILEMALVLRYRQWGDCPRLQEGVEWLQRLPSRRQLLCGVREGLLQCLAHSMEPRQVSSVRGIGLCHHLTRHGQVLLKLPGQRTVLHGHRGSRRYGRKVIL